MSWLGSTDVRALELRWFNSRPPNCRVVILGKSFMCANASEVTTVWHCRNMINYLRRRRYVLPRAEALECMFYP